MNTAHWYCEKYVFLGIQFRNVMFDENAVSG